MSEHSPDYDLQQQLGLSPTEYEKDAEFSFRPFFNFVSRALAASPLNILQEAVFERSRQLIFSKEDDNDNKKAIQVYKDITESLKAEVDIINKEGINVDASEHEQVIKHYIYLIYISIQNLVHLFVEEEKGKRKESRSPASANIEKKRIQHLNKLLYDILTALCDLMNCQLSSIFNSEQELIEFCDVVLKCTYSILMSKETIKEKNNRSLLVTLICTIAKNHQQNNQVCRRLTMALPFSEHLAEPIAEIVASSIQYHDNRILIQNVMDEFSNIPDVGTNLAKNISIFLVHLSEILGSEGIVFHELFDKFSTSTQTVRAALMVCYGNFINFVSADDELTKAYIDTIQELIYSITQSVMDSHQLVRHRSLQALETIQRTKNTELNLKYYLFEWTEIAIRHLEDKSSFVRKSALGLLDALIIEHPFAVLNGKLTWEFFWKEYLETTRNLRCYDQGKLFNVVRQKELEECTYISILADDEEPEGVNHLFKQVLGAIPDEEIPEEIPEEIQYLIHKREYCRDACIFIKMLDKSFEIVGYLLNSKVKNDVLGAIDYFVDGDAFDITSAKYGAKKMLHLIWSNGSNEDGNKIVEKLTDAYVRMFLTPNYESSEKEKNTYIAVSLIRLTYNCSMADLISLEKLLVEIYRGRVIDVSKKEKEMQGYVERRKYWINGGVINILWNSFVNPKYVKEKRGAIIILSMLALEDPRIVNNKIDLLLKYGLQTENLNYQIATFSCIALRRANPNKPPKNFVPPNFSEVIPQLQKILMIETTNGDWFNLASEALTTLYEIDPDANVSATEVLKLNGLSLFSDNGQSDNTGINKIISLSQFFFLLGHIGLKTLVYLEKCEIDFKRKKQEKESEKDDQDLELDMIGGTNEDDFTDTILNIKEKQLLYGENSILGKFRPLLIEIISKPKKYKNEFLQRHATLCFVKFMCISPKFCEDYLGLLINLMVHSRDPIVRSNLNLGLGDVAVSFTNIVDDNRKALYTLLQDRDLAVQRTCLMTVTFLILAGQIKVKGQLSQLAKLLVHEDKGLSDTAKLFFQELATKDNAIYNGFIEMLSGLNQHIDDPTQKEAQFPLDKFKQVVKFVLPFINKEKQRNQLIRKLDDRLKLCSRNEWERYTFCIKELIRKDDTGLRKDKESEKTKYYQALLTRIQEEETERINHTENT